MADLPFNYLSSFLNESNMIEGIKRNHTKEEYEATDNLLSLERVMIPDLLDLVKVYQPDAVLRDKKGLNVRVGNHYPPAGGPRIPKDLEEILIKVSGGITHLYTPFEGHCEYETLHPFTDGNGRSGRALWLYHMLKKKRKVSLSFLHHFYYQTLDGGR